METWFVVHNVRYTEYQTLRKPKALLLVHESEDVGKQAIMHGITRLQKLCDMLLCDLWNTHPKPLV